MVGACYLDRKNHNVTTLQLESSHITISADGKCFSAVSGVEHLDVIEVVIDGNKLMGGADSPTLLGSSDSFLSESSLYELSHFEPMDDGRCLARYTRCKK